MRPAARAAKEPFCRKDPPAIRRNVWD